MKNEYHVTDLKGFIQITQEEKEDIFFFRKDYLSNIEPFPIQVNSTFAVDFSYGEGGMRAEFRTKDEATTFAHQVVGLLNK